MAATESVSRHRLLLYGDQTDNAVPCIKNLYRQAKLSVLLTRYLRGCSDALQLEISKLGLEDRRHLPSFNTILDLAEKHERTDGSGVFVSLILCYLSRVGELIMCVPSK